MSLLETSKKKLALLGIDSSKKKGVYVQFDENKKEYLYIIGIEESIKKGDYVVAPVYDNRKLKLAKVISVFDEDDGNVITDKQDEQLSKTVHNILSLEIEPTLDRPLLRSIALNIFSEEDVLLSPYFESLEKAKRKVEVLKELEEAAEEERKMQEYRNLRYGNEKIDSLLNELKDL